jgi:hypothetical protein
MMSEEKLLSFLNVQELEMVTLAKNIDFKLFLKQIRNGINSGQFTIDHFHSQDQVFKKGTMVQHVDHINYGIGEVLKIENSGKRAFVMFPDYNKNHIKCMPKSYYMLSKLFVVEK